MLTCRSCTNLRAGRFRLLQDGRGLAALGAAAEAQPGRIDADAADAGRFANPIAGDCIVQWQDFPKQIGGLPIGQMGGPLGLQVLQFRSDSARWGTALHGGLTKRRGSPGLPAQLPAHSRGLGTSTLPNTVRMTIDRLSLCASAEPQRQQTTWLFIQLAICCDTRIDSGHNCRCRNWLNSLRV